MNNSYRKRQKKLNELLAQRERENARVRAEVVAEFNADPERLAEEILRVRRALSQLAKAVAITREGRQFALIGPGTYAPPPKKVPEYYDHEADRNEMDAAGVPEFDEDAP